ncbi:MAG TPA: citrate/2-methylcitrate synthase [bacterium]|nr:citrate/2-methylcitrate synthase [bacterium]
MAVEFKAGLKDVVAVNSSISTVDGEAGRLIYRGYDIRDLARQATYEEVVHLLWNGELPTRTQLETITRQLAANRALDDNVLASMRTYPRTAHPLEAIRTAVSVAGMYDPDSRANTDEANKRKAVRLTAQIPTMVGTVNRLRGGQEPVRPRAEGSTAASFLTVMMGKEPSPVAERTMDMILVLHAEHELNASTFAARISAATFSDLHSDIVAALAALKGPRHGGANEDVLAMLLAIGDPSRAEPFIQRKLDARAKMTHEERALPENRIPGFGHAVYKVDDPRAGVLREMARQLSEEARTLWLFEIATKVYETMHRNTDLPVNVDFFSAVVYHALGIPIDLCTSIFAAARISGWSAHAMEQYHDRLIRPRAHYTGPALRAFVPLADRR